MPLAFYPYIAYPSLLKLKLIDLVSALPDEEHLVVCQPPRRSVLLALLRERDVVTFAHLQKY